jgi:hypothetical protein
MRKAIDRSFLTWLLKTTGLSLTLVTASAAGARADIASVHDADGAARGNGVTPSELK